jgi:hypothetical protein
MTRRAALTMTVAATLLAALAMTPARAAAPSDPVLSCLRLSTVPDGVDMW